MRVLRKILRSLLFLSIIFTASALGSNRERIRFGGGVISSLLGVAATATTAALLMQSIEGWHVGLHTTSEALTAYVAPDPTATDLRVFCNLAPNAWHLYCASRTLASHAQGMITSFFFHDLVLIPTLFVSFTSWFVFLRYWQPLGESNYPASMLIPGLFLCPTSLLIAFFTFCYPLSALAHDDWQSEFPDLQMLFQELYDVSLRILVGNAILTAIVLLQHQILKKSFVFDQVGGGAVGGGAVAGGAVALELTGFATTTFFSGGYFAPSGTVPTTEVF